MEQEARRRGWVKPGEIALSVIGSDPDPYSAPAKPNDAVRTASSVSDRIRAAVDTCLAVFGGGRARAQ